MTLLKTAAVTVLAWGALGSFAEAAPMSWFGSSNVSAWYANQTLANGGFYAPSTSPVAAAMPAWYSSPSYLASLGPAPQPRSAAPLMVSHATPGVDAFINMTSGGFANASALTTGNPQPWYASPAAAEAFDGTPNSTQQANFVNSVVDNVQRTFRNSGLDISLTTDPNVPARHMLSVVSGASYPSNPNAIGITTVGGDGFSFIDKLAYADNPDELAWAVAHNVSHELMHALGVSDHPDATGEYLDTATANWGMLTNPDTKFSPEAVELVKTAAAGGGSYGGIEGAQDLAAPVPEPATLAVWSISAAGALFAMRRRSGRRAA